MDQAWINHIMRRIGNNYRYAIRPWYIDAYGNPVVWGELLTADQWYRLTQLVLSEGYGL